MKNLTIFLTILLLTSCKSWQPSMISVNNDPISEKLLPLNGKVEDNYTQIGRITMRGNKITRVETINNEDSRLQYLIDSELFKQEIEKNLINQNDGKYGYITFKREIEKFKGSLGYPILSGLTMTIANLFGMPFIVWKHKVEVEVNIINSQNKSIGKYSAIGEGKTRVAYYYGYGMQSGIYRSYSEATKDALKKIRLQIQSDAKKLNEVLKEAGKL